MTEFQNIHEELAAFVARCIERFSFLTGYGFEGPKHEVVLGRQANVGYWKPGLYITIKYDTTGPPWVVLGHAPGHYLHEIGLHEVVEQRCPDLLPPAMKRSFDEMMDDLDWYARAIDEHLQDFLAADAHAIFGDVE